MDRESLTRIGMRTFAIDLGENGHHAEIPVVAENSGIFFVGQHSPPISTGPEGVGSILGKIYYIVGFPARGPEIFGKAFYIKYFGLFKEILKREGNSFHPS
jgi:hypothetical protein